MKIQLIAFVLIIATSLSLPPAKATDRMVEGFPELPRDARDVAERSLACQHFGGEVNGTGDERDKEVAHQLRQLKCSHIERDFRRIKAKYRKNQAVLQVLQEAALGKAA